MSNIDELKARFEEYVNALNSLNLNAVKALWHKQIVGFGSNSPFPAEGEPEEAELVQRLFENSDNVIVTPINPQFRIIGDTGIVWAHQATTVKPKGGPLQTVFNRVTLTWVKPERTWLLLAVHLSRIPSGN